MLFVTRKCIVMMAKVYVVSVEFIAKMVLLEEEDCRCLDSKGSGCGDMAVNFC